MGSFEHLIQVSENRKQSSRLNLPSEFSMILGVLPSITATAELVVPILPVSVLPP